MDTEASLNEREAMILHAVVQCYVTTAEPVGSRTIVKRFGLDLSPATVRNVMADLEEAGYIEQVHTSSGRIPTDRGYRYYVDYLMRAQELTLAERARIERDLSQKLNDADEVMRQTSQLLALISYQTGVVQTPDDRTAEIRHIEVTPIGAGRAAVLIADNFGRVHTVMTTLAEPLVPDDLPRLNGFLNGSLRGVALDQLGAQLHVKLASLMDEHRRVAERALRVLDLLPQEPGRLYLEGAAQLFQQPEFRDIEKARELFGVLEERNQIMGLLRTELQHGATPSRTTVVIGSESSEPGLKEISVVASPYRVGGQPAGMVGVLGPRRMPYPKLTAIVDYTADMLGRLLTRLAQ